MWESLLSLPVEKLAPTIIFGGAFLVGAIGIVARTWQCVRRAEIDADLKREMLARGMSADDIVRVIEEQSGRESN